MPRRVVEQELSRERILEEARTLFANHGYQTLTMRSIAREMGYSHGALYYHFKDKADLFYALVIKDFTLLLEMEGQLLSRMRLGDVSHLKRMMLAFIEFGLGHPHHYEIMFMIQDPGLRHYSRSEQAQCLDLFASVVRGVIAGQPDMEKRLYTLPWSLFMSLHGFISYSIHYKQTFAEVKKMAEEHVDFLCAGLV